MPPRNGPPLRKGGASGRRGEMKHTERQKRGASLSDDDDNDDDDDVGSEGEDEDLVALQSTLDVSCGSGDGVGPSGADRPASVMTEESSARKRAASSPLRGLSPKHPRATTDGGQDSSGMAFVTPSLMELEAPVHGENVKSAARRAP
jgi:hypothetical protein